MASAVVAMDLAFAGFGRINGDAARIVALTASVPANVRMWETGFIDVKFEF